MLDQNRVDSLCGRRCDRVISSLWRRAVLGVAMDDLGIVDDVGNGEAVTG